MRALAFAIGDIEPLDKGDTVTHYTPGGGGYGDPGERRPEQVASDVRAGLVTVDAALNHYGVEVNPMTFEARRVRA